MIYVLRVTIIKMYLQLATYLPYTINLRQNKQIFEQRLWRLSSIDYIFKSGKI